MCATKALMDAADTVEKTDPREFIRLLMENERRIYAYILTLLGNGADAEDVLQETSIILWDKFAEFQPNPAIPAKEKTDCISNPQSQTQQKQPNVLHGYRLIINAHPYC